MLANVMKLSRMGPVSLNCKILFVSLLVVYSCAVCGFTFSPPQPEPLKFNNSCVCEEGNLKTIYQTLCHRTEQ